MYKLTLVYPSPRNQIKREGLFFFLSASWREDRREAAALVSSALVMSFLYTSDDPAWLACVRRLGKRAVNKNTIPGPRYIKHHCQAGQTLASQYLRTRGFIQGVRLHFPFRSIEEPGLVYHHSTSSVNLTSLLIKSCGTSLTQATVMCFRQIYRCCFCNIVHIVPST